MHIELGKNRVYTHKKKKVINQTNGYGQVSFHGRFYTSYKLRFTLLIFIKYIILQKIGVVGIQFGKYPYRLYTMSALVCYLEEFVSMKISMIY